MPRKKRSKEVLENLRIERYAADGKCIGKHDGKVIFVAGTVPGDEVKVVLTKNKKDWAEAKLLHINTPSPVRQDPQCSYFGKCGGCQWQMLDYQLQAKYKYDQVKEQMSKIGGIDNVEVSTIKTSDVAWRYRNKVEFSFSNRQYLDADQLNDKSYSQYENVLGFHAKGFFDKVVAIEDCKIQPEKGNEVRNAISKFCKEKNYSYYDLREHEGFLRNLMIRETEEREIMLNLMVNDGYREELDEILEFIKTSFPDIHSLYYTINTKKNDSIYDLDPVWVYGAKYITERLGDFLFRIGPKSFFQTNTSQAEVLYASAKKLLDLNGDELIYDLYCGTGSIGIYMSDKAAHVIGVETVEEAVEDARENAKLNNVEDKCSFYQGEIEKLCTPEFFEQHGEPDVLILDPPRVGLMPKATEYLMEIKAPRILYISCNPATQARDLDILKEIYEIEALQPVDLFPQTHHIENIALLRLKN